MLPLHASLVPIEDGPAPKADSAPADSDFLDLVPPLVDTQPTADEPDEAGPDQRSDLRRLPPLDVEEIWEEAEEADVPSMARRLPELGAESSAVPPAGVAAPAEPRATWELPLADDAPVLLPASPPGGGQSTSASLVDAVMWQRIEQQLAPRVMRAERLAARGACYAARAELLQSLRTFAQALDGHGATHVHEESFRRALCALRESQDFVPNVSSLDAELPLEQFINGHRTPVLREVALHQLTPASARQCYLDYAQQQLTASCGHLPGSSRVLYLLGRVYAEMDRATFQPETTYLPQAVVMHRAALLIDPANALAANELGVLCARFQQLDEAQRLLLHSAATCPAPETWHNLSVVHERLGQLELARRAAQQSQIVAAQHAEQSALAPGPVPAGEMPTPLAPPGIVEPEAESSCNGCQSSPPCAGAWQVFDQGEYIGPTRAVDVPEYRLRVDDQLEFVYQLMRTESPQPYSLQIGDRVRVESLTDANLTRELTVQPDGMITVPLLGQVRAVRRTVTELRDELEAGYAAYQKVPSITVTPLVMNAPWEDLRSAIAGQDGSGGQTLQCRVAPEGTVQLPAIGSVPAHGLTLDELQQEIEQRYATLLHGVGVTPRLMARAPRYVFVAGEVRRAGRYCLTGPTTALQALAMAGGACPTGLTQHVVIFRRTEDWRLMTTCVNLRSALQGNCTCGTADVFLRDGDVVIVPKKGCWRGDRRLDWNLLRSLHRALPLPGAAISVCRPSTL
jgi:polysaccharide export outer membrane protein